MAAEAGGEELGAVGFAKVEQDALRGWLVAWGRHVEPLERIGFVAGAKLVEPFCGISELRGELRGDFGADFVAAAANGGADGGQQVNGPRAEVHLHLADGFDDDAAECAAPSGVDGGDGTLLRIREKDGDAVGGLDGEKQALAIGGRSVAMAGFRRRGIKEVDDVRMDLLEGEEREAACAESGLETATVFEDIFGSVPVREAKIENVLAFEQADAAGPSAEAVNQPRKFR